MIDVLTVKKPRKKEGKMRKNTRKLSTFVKFYFVYSNWTKRYFAIALKCKIRIIVSLVLC